MRTEHRFTATAEKGEVSAILMRPENAASLIVLGHGASSTMRSPLISNIAEALFNAGVATFRYNFPYSENGRGRDSQAVCVETVRSAIAAAESLASDLKIFAGGHSFGGRMTTTAVSMEVPERLSGLVLFGFPLHHPGKPAIERAAHLSDVAVPMLFISGDRDSLADTVLLERSLAQCPQAELYLAETADHSFKVLKRSRTVVENVFDEIARAAAAWCSKIN